MKTVGEWVVGIGLVVVIAFCFFASAALKIKAGTASGDVQQFRFQMINAHRDQHGRGFFVVRDNKTQREFLCNEDGGIIEVLPAASEQ